MLSQLAREFQADVTAESLQVEYGQSVLLEDTRPLPLQVGRGVIRAWPRTGADGAGPSNVMVEVKGERPDTGEIVWFLARCGAFSDTEAVLADFISESADQPFQDAVAFDDLVELSPGLWWQPPLLSFMHEEVVWAAPIRLVRLFTKTRHYVVCDMKYLRLDESGYFAWLPKCLSFLATWIK